MYVEIWLYLKVNSWRQARVFKQNLKNFQSQEYSYVLNDRRKKSDFVFWHGLMPSSSETKAIYLFWCEIVLNYKCLLRN